MNAKFIDALTHYQYKHKYKITYLNVFISNRLLSRLTCYTRILTRLCLDLNKNKHMTCYKADSSFEGFY